MTADNGRALARTLVYEALRELADYYREHRPDDPVRLADVLTVNAAVLNGDYAACAEPLERIMRDLDGRLDADGDSDGYRPNAEMSLYVELERVRAQVARLAKAVTR